MRPPLINDRLSFEIAKNSLGEALVSRPPVIASCFKLLKPLHVVQMKTYHQAVEF